MGPGQLVLAGVLHRQLLPEASTMSTSPRLPQPPTNAESHPPSRVERPLLSLRCWEVGNGTGPSPPSSLTLNSFTWGRARRGGSLCSRSLERGRTRPEPGGEAEESRSPDRMALKLIYDPLWETARSQVGASTFPALRCPVHSTAATLALHSEPRGLQAGDREPSPPLGRLPSIPGGSRRQRWGWVPSEPPSGQASAAQGHRAGRREGQLPENALSQPGTQLREGQSLDSCPRATDALCWTIVARCRDTGAYHLHIGLEDPRGQALGSPPDQCRQGRGLGGPPAATGGADGAAAGAHPRRLNTTSPCDLHIPPGDAQN
ncbi:uncharacterized protein LOC120603908 [Pteropus medius]|uniref:uncharacterized protein LOC120603908 n=1 Tax=Pteropus vampyrus TaxID=132908 RepID=UPI00196AC723|nr:uncharacterized protein LOC120603908 [Pteropus giganteus]